MEGEKLCNRNNKLSTSTPAICNNLKLNKCCDNCECESWIDWLETGNCFKRVMRPHTLAEVGIALGITRERVRQIEERAMRHLKAAIEKKKEMFRELIDLDFN
jgi:hypothetical protein